MKVSSHRMLRVQAVIAGWLFVFFLVRTMAADSAPDASLPAALEPLPAKVQDAAPVEQEGAIPTFSEFGSSEGVATTLAPSTNLEALPQVTPELNRDVKSAKPEVFSHLRPDFATLMLFFCLF